jgi:CBS domain containing-hemolysin-like protein
MALLLLYLSLAILVSFLCSVLEAALLSFTPSFIANFQQQDAKNGKRLRQYKEDIDQPLSAILSLNTIAHTVGAAGVGAQAAVVFGDNYVGITSAVLTLMILVFSEIIPKTLGAKYWKELARFTIHSLRVILIITYPLVWLSNFITRLINQKQERAAVSRSELSALAEWGKEEGVFHESESRIIKNLIFLRSIKVRDVMTPRTVVMSASEEEALSDIFKNKDFLKFSRIPVYRENRENVTGYVHKHEMLERLANDQHDMKLGNIKRDITVVPENKRLPDMFDNLIENKEQIALVVDEYGGMAGIVTLEDIIETLIGLEIIDEFDPALDMQQFARDRWRRRASEIGLIPSESEEQDKQEDKSDSS